MTAQPIKGLGSEAIPACNVVKNFLKKSLQKLRKDEEGEGIDFSGSLA